MQNSSEFQYLAVDTIHESATNPRRTFDEAKLQELAESIRTNGLIQPITVRPNSEGFEIVAGARRFRAAQLADPYTFADEIAKEMASEDNKRTAEEVLLASIDGLGDEKLTGFTLRLALTTHVAIPRDGDLDFLAEAATAFLKPKPRKAKKTQTPTPVKSASKKIAA